MKFRNNHSFVTNLIFFSFTFFCRITYFLSGRFTFPSVLLSKKGYEFLGILRLKEIDFNFLLTRDCIGGCIPLGASESKNYDMWVYSLVEQMKPKVERALGSFFEILWYEIQATVPLQESQQGSFFYHTDDTPVPVKKLFLYLTDTTKESGAFRAFDYETTDDLIARGMLNSSSPGESRAGCQNLITPDIESKLQIFEGKKGTFFLFDNNLIHKGTLPEKEHRIIISFELIPALSEITYEKFLANVCSNTEKKFFLNPFSRKYFQGAN